MKLYYIGPKIDVQTMAPEVIEERMRRAVEPIADLVFAQFRPDTFHALVGLSCLNRPEQDEEAEAPPPYPPLISGQEAFGRWRATRFGSEAAVRAALVNMGDSDVTPELFSIRSIISCRSVSYGYDGQAFLCLRTEDEPPVSPDTDLVLVEERQDLLTDTDYADGVEAVQDW
jgi:hypothetical protein